MHAYVYVYTYMYMCMYISSYTYVCIGLNPPYIIGAMDARRAIPFNGFEARRPYCILGCMINMQTYTYEYICIYVCIHIYTGFILPMT